MAIKEVKIEKKKHKLSKKKIALTCVGSVLAAYGVFMLVHQQVQINQKSKELAELEDKIVIQEVKNKDINSVYQSNESENAEYIERLARENLDYAHKGERIFINISGE